MLLAAFRPEEAFAFIGAGYLAFLVLLVPPFDSEYNRPCIFMHYVNG
jgi:hypothetical protein